MPARKMERIERRTAVGVFGGLAFGVVLAVVLLVGVVVERLHHGYGLIAPGPMSPFSYSLPIIALIAGPFLGILLEALFLSYVDGLIFAVRNYRTHRSEIKRIFAESVGRLMIGGFGGYQFALDFNCPYPYVWMIACGLAFAYGRLRYSLYQLMYNRSDID